MKIWRIGVLVVALAVAGCTSSTSGKAHTGTSSGGVPSGMPTTAAGLAALMQTGIADVRSAHLRLDVTVIGQALTGSGSEQLSHGQLEALDITEQLPQGGDLRVIVIDGKTYAKLPKSFNPSGKPWLPVTSKSSNEVIRALAGSLDSALSSASLGNLAVFTKAAKSISVVGAAKVGSFATTHYHLVVDLSRLPASFPGRQELVSGGVKTLPLDLYVDRLGRPIELSENFNAQGQAIKTQVIVDAYDKPVTITAPPADQIGS